MRYTPLALLAGAALLTFPASAQDMPSWLSGEIVIELQNEYTASADDTQRDEHNNLFLRTEIAPTAQLNENFFIDGVIVLEPVQDFDADENNTLEETGIFFEELKLNYENGPWAAFAGKFNPGFGIAWDFGRGIWSEDFAEDYEITESIGFGAAYTFEGQNTGAHTLTASTFFADTTFLSGSLGVSRGQTDKEDGGASNTEDFSSFVLSLEGDDLAGVENLSYKLAYRQRAQGDADTGGDDEQGFAITLGHALTLSDRVDTDMLLEYVDISHYDGGADDNRYITASAVTTFDENWNVTVGFTQRDISAETGNDIEDQLLQISAGYDFGQGTTAELGWRSSEEGDQDTDIIGGLIRHVIAF